MALVNYILLHLYHYVHNVSAIHFFVYELTPGIEAVNETGIPSDTFGASLYIHGTIILSLKCYHRIPLSNAFFLIIILALIVFIIFHDNITLYYTTSTRKGDDVTGCEFTTMGSFLWDYCSEVFPPPPPYLFSWISSIHNTDIKWIHSIHIESHRMSQDRKSVVTSYEIQYGNS